MKKVTVRSLKMYSKIDVKGFKDALKKAQKSKDWVQCARLATLINASEYVGSDAFIDDLEYIEDNLKK